MDPDPLPPWRRRHVIRVRGRLLWLLDRMPHYTHPLTRPIWWRWRLLERADRRHLEELRRRDEAAPR